MQDKNAEKGAGLWLEDAALGNRKVENLCSRKAAKAEQKIAHLLEFMI